MKQKVHSVSYLAKAEFEYKNGVYDLVAIPSGAEVVKVSLEVVGTPTTGSIKVGFKDENEKNYFLTLENGQTNKNATSAKDYTATSNKVVVAEVKNAANTTDIKGVLRVLYFLPSVIEVEY
ncbi:hypothetical protein [Helicobacter pylori]|uniref:hypothetical protein n=1 Tax=Helicobacter pylori TaxID=210 RepID=UPI000EADDDD8|nr:hypothetical protein [Helicobacter pylori]RKV44236.1 hypothetical protein DD767_08120 [Helicobacter pylori]